MTPAEQVRALITEWADANGIGDADDQVVVEGGSRFGDLAARLTPVFERAQAAALLDAYGGPVEAAATLKALWDLTEPKS